MNSSGYRNDATCPRSCGNETARGRGSSVWGWLLRLRAAGIAAAVAVLFILGTGAAQPAQAQVESVIHSFSGANSTGKYLYGGLLRDSNTGNLFGTTYQGGTSNLGTVFEEVYDPSTHSYTEKSLLSFDGSYGANPWSDLIMDSNGNLYGTTYYGGANGDGTVFELVYSSSTKAYTEDVLFSFAALSANTGNLLVNATGANPEAGLVMDSSGNLYGTTVYGGSGGDGTVFKLSPPATTGASWTEDELHSFTGYNSTTPASSDGANPESGLMMDTPGNLYGATYNGGSNEYGAVFEEVYNSSTKTYTEKVLHSFDYLDGYHPYADLLMDSFGNLYGTTVYGGSDSDGVVFELTQASGYATENVLLNFTGADGGYPRAGLMMDTQGNLYGTTYNGGAEFAGTVFELTRASGYQTEQVLHTFTGPDGKWPHAPVLMDPLGNLYGTTYIGGPNEGEGTVFGIAPVTLSSSTLDFGTVGAGVASAAQTVTLTNDGSGSLSFGTATISGANASDFSIGSTDTCSGQTVAAGSSCSVSVTFTPSISTAETASLNLMEAGIDVTVGLEGSGVSVMATLSPNLTFPDTLVGTTSAPLKVTLANTSTGSALTIDSISVSANFTEGTTTCGSSLAAGSSCTINVAFSPAAKGSLTGTLTVTDNTSSGSQTVNLSGTGVTAAGYIQDVMIPQVESLNLANGQTNSLMKELNQAYTMIGEGKINGAIENLEQFIAEVNDLYSSGKLSQQEATTLINEANYVINSLE